MANIIIGVVSLIVSIIFLLESLKLTLGTFASPASGLFPFIIAILASLLSIILIFDGFRKKDFTFNLIKLVKPILGLIFFIVFLVFWKWVGYFAACAALLMLWLRCIGREKWVISIVATVLVTLGFYAVFVILLDIPLPV